MLEENVGRLLRVSVDMQTKRNRTTKARSSETMDFDPCSCVKPVECSGLSQGIHVPFYEMLCQVVALDTVPAFRTAVVPDHLLTLITP